MGKVLKLVLISNKHIPVLISIEKFRKVDKLVLLQEFKKNWNIVYDNILNYFNKLPKVLICKSAKIGTNLKKVPKLAFL